eukprot:scpid63649/ scgid32292/ 
MASSEGGLLDSADVELGTVPSQPTNVAAVSTTTASTGESASSTHLVSSLLEALRQKDTTGLAGIRLEDLRTIAEPLIKEYVLSTAAGSSLSATSTGTPVAPPSSGAGPAATTTTTTTGVTATATTGKLSKTANILEVFANDQTDVALISGFSGTIAFLNASATNSYTTDTHTTVDTALNSTTTSVSLGTTCSDVERAIGWSFWGLVIIIYILRHFVIDKAKYESRPMWYRVVRCVVFALFLLTLNEQPLMCETSLDNTYSVRYAQAALWTGLALFAGNVLALPTVEKAYDKRKEQKESSKVAVRVESSEPLMGTTAAATASSTSTTSTTSIGQATPKPSVPI